MRRCLHPTSCFSPCFHHYPPPTASPLVTQKVSGASGASPATTTKANHPSAAAFAIFHCRVGDFGNCGPKNRCLVLLCFFGFFILFFAFLPSLGAAPQSWRSLACNCRDSSVLSIRGSLARRGCAMKFFDVRASEVSLKQNEIKRNKKTNTLSWVVVSLSTAPHIQIPGKSSLSELPWRLVAFVYFIWKAKITVVQCCFFFFFENCLRSWNVISPNERELDELCQYSCKKKKKHHKLHLPFKREKMCIYILFMCVCVCILRY